MRTSGILMPIFSLASPYGIGTLGKEARAFVDFLHKAGQRHWQILPLNPTTFGNSPYQSYSAFAGNPYLIDLDMLKADGLLTPQELAETDFGSDPARIDYDLLRQHRLPLLRRAYARFDGGEAFARFCCEEAAWLEDYALFTAIKDACGGAHWRQWALPLRRRDETALQEARDAYADEIRFCQFQQYLFYTQWRALKAYANGKDVAMIGDMPIYVSDDSADVWAHPHLFDLDEDLLPRVVAGCPPDAFSADGQLWGMPVYNWQAMAEEDIPYGWWRSRVRHALTVYDTVRIDHFRGFESYYCIPYGAKDAKKGRWRKGPGMKLFRALQQDADKPLPIIAEDLGFLTPAVRKLREQSGFPGMKVLQFAFDSREESDYLPHHYHHNCVVYTGTHDNDTVMGWVATADPADVQLARRYLHVDDEEGFNWAMIRAALASVADTAILTMQDVMGLGSEGRINTPSTVGGNNWCWRIGDGCVNDWLAGIVLENTVLYGRAPRPAEDE